MDSGLEPCIASGSWQVQNEEVSDLLSSLDDGVLIRILSLLPSKDVAATCVLSKRLMRVFPWIMSLDFDVSPLSLCHKHPHRVELYPSFVTFVYTVLEAHQSQHLTGFRLRVGSVDFGSRYFYVCTDHHCKEPCMPDLKSSQINAWIRFPLTRFGLRELDLCIWVREPGDTQLPQQIFTCETLEVLKLDTNLDLGQIFAMPSYCLPNLKLFHLCASLVSDDDFVTRLVSNCPVLEDLSIEAWRDHVDHTIIYSPSLRKLRIRFLVLEEFDNCDSVLIDTPNLEYFEYLDNLAYHYSIPEMHSLVKARINMNYDFDHEDNEVSYHQLLRFIRPFCNVHHLTLLGCFTEDLDRAEVKDQLPVFPNLSHLELGRASNKYYWDKVLLAFLNRSPVLETLVFLQGLTMYYGAFSRGYEQLESELEVFRALHAIPSCCRYHLKRIETHNYYGLQREIEIIQFLLRHALVLEELVIYRAVHGPFDQFTHQCRPVADLMSMESTLNNLPRASATC